MTRKENSNGNYFEAWLQEYKTRLEQAKLHGISIALDRKDELTTGASQEHDSNENTASPPALAGQIYTLLQSPAAHALNR